MRFFAELQNDQGEDMLQPIVLSELSIEAMRSDPLYSLNGQVYYPPVRRTGTLKMRFIQEATELQNIMPSLQDHLMTTRSRYTINIKQGYERDVRSYNIFRGCFVRSINWTPLNMFDGASYDHDLIEVEMDWVYNDCDAVLNPPQELQTQEQLHAEYNRIHADTVRRTAEWHGWGIDDELDFDHGALWDAGERDVENLYRGHGRPSVENTISVLNWRQFGF